ncbi:hypothetical protein [Blautia producta]|uniref:hypothetical protein n=1 Tax=Blautia producta TaxID=33035 RepID=UPI0036F3A274
MQVNVSFESLKEMKEFIDRVYVGERAKNDNGVSTQPQTVPVTQPTPSVQQPAAQVVSSTVQQQPVTQIQTAPVQQSVPPVQNTVPTSTPSYALDDLARAAMTLVDTGRQAELQALLAAFSVNSLPELQPEKYGAFATALREKGAQI